jgi:cytochrome c
MCRLWLVACLAGVAGCPGGNDPPPMCVDVDTTCAELYAPTFDNVYTRTLRDTCGSQRVSCHSAAGLAGGMSFDTEDSAYAALTASRVTGGDPSCSKMIVRVTSVGETYQMPPGSPLSDPEQCSLIKWVQMGAMR